MERPRLDHLHLNLTRNSNWNCWTPNQALEELIRETDTYRPLAAASVEEHPAQQEEHFPASEAEPLQGTEIVGRQRAPSAFERKGPMACLSSPWPGRPFHLSSPKRSVPWSN